MSKAKEFGTEEKVSITQPEGKTGEWYTFVPTKNINWHGFYAKNFATLPPLELTNTRIDFVNKAASENIQHSFTTHLLDAARVRQSEMVRIAYIDENILTRSSISTGSLSDQTYEESFFEEQIDQIIARMDKTINLLDQNSQKLSQSREKVATFRQKDESNGDVVEFK